jgi:hypothetical protein
MNLLAALQNPAFDFGVVTTIMIGISGGTVHLTDMVPEAWIKPITGWTAFFAFVDSAILTALQATPAIH